MCVCVCVQVSAGKKNPVSELWPDTCRLERFHLMYFPLIAKNNKSMSIYSLQLPSKIMQSLEWRKGSIFYLKWGELQGLCNLIIQFLYFTDEVPQSWKQSNNFSKLMVELGLAEGPERLNQEFKKKKEFSSILIIPKPLCFRREKKYKGLCNVEFHHMTIAISGNENFWQFTTPMLGGTSTHELLCLLACMTSLPVFQTAPVPKYKTAEAILSNSGHSLHVTLLAPCQIIHRLSDF